jgi:hypothetical protein
MDLAHQQLIRPQNISSIWSNLQADLNLSDQQRAAICFVDAGLSGDSSRGNR